MCCSVPGDRGLRTAYEILLGGYDNYRISSTNSTVKKVPTPSQGMRRVRYFFTFIHMVVIILLLPHFIQDCINFRNQGRT